ncbi:phosphoesterase HXTX [Aureimonas sp. Leaf454]|uniref:2'-5' RNA ligase family protein n=1 Tax=Aureimonas sp. Leaf454 TaxID=1736381 RepID=UPI0006F9E73A|nr:2'-5' RNA ligase family protein [Aureimonas sp. Leaf454]KQT50771.1 phosphoesterase HXTX [Aureimonas sp. Leaf454]
MTDIAPLILTLAFDDDSFRHFNDMRRRHFPKARNHIPAHLTLFHHLPGEDEAEIARMLEDVAKTTAPLTLQVTGLRFLGYGSAYTLESAPLAALRAALAARWRDRLTRQDAQGFRPHVTIQNKASAPEARRLFETLDSEFRPFEATGTGLRLWRYRGGPWDEAGAFSFRG